MHGDAMHCTKRSALKAIDKLFETLTSKKAAVLGLTTWLLIHGYVTQEVFVAVAMTFLGTLGMIDYKAKIAELGKTIDSPDRSPSSAGAGEGEPVPE
jgi:hypothetical protein